MPTGPERGRPVRRAWLAVVAIVVAVLVVGSAATTLILLRAEAASSGPVDLKGNRVALDPGDSVTPAERTKQDAAGSGHGRFEVPSVGLDVPLGALNEVDGQITPPDFTSVYLVRNRGVSIGRAAVGTVFVVTHSLRGGGSAPGNYLIDVGRGTASLTKGSLVRVDGVSYAVDGYERVGKRDLASDARVWANAPGRLVIITCLQVPAGTEGADNLVITATRAP